MSVERSPWNFAENLQPEQREPLTSNQHARAGGTIVIKSALTNVPLVRCQRYVEIGRCAAEPNYLNCVGHFAKLYLSNWEKGSIPVWTTYDRQSRYAPLLLLQLYSVVRTWQFIMILIKPSLSSYPTPAQSRQLRTDTLSMFHTSYTVKVFGISAFWNSLKNFSACFALYRCSTFTKLYWTGHYYMLKDTSSQNTTV